MRRKAGTRRPSACSNFLSRSTGAKHRAGAVCRWPQSHSISDAIASGRMTRSKERAPELWLLAEGAMVRILIHGDRSSASAAAEAGKARLRKLARSCWRHVFGPYAALHANNLSEVIGVTCCRSTTRLSPYEVRPLNHPAASA
jgi:hypothetical protein